METRTDTSGQKPTESALPKWKQKANWILRQYSRIWNFRDDFYTLDFEVAFKDVFVQLFLDEGLLEKDAEGCITFAYNEFRLRHGCEPVFPTKGKKWEWICENGLFSFLKNEFFSHWVIEEVLYIADYTEQTLKEYEEYLDYDFIFRYKNPGIYWSDYDFPCLPPHGHEWVDDPWKRLGK